MKKEKNIKYHNNIYSLFHQSCNIFHDKIAVSNFNSSIKYKNLLLFTKIFSNFLFNKINLKKGDRIAIILPNSIQYLISIFSSLRLGLIIVNINPLYTAREMHYQIKNSNVSTIIIMENFLHILDKINALDSSIKIEKKNIIVAKIYDFFSFFKRSMFKLYYKINKIIPYNIKNTIYFSDILKNKDHYYDDYIKNINVNRKDLAFIQYTGGTTGIPKGVMLNHGNILSNIEQSFSWCGSFFDNKDDIAIIPLPLYHIFSLVVSSFFLLNKGVHIVLITDPRNTKSFIKFIKNIKFSIFIGLDTLFNSLINHKKFKNINFSNIRLTISGGVPLRKKTSDEWKKITGNQILEGYGMTEASPIISINPLNTKKFNYSVGKILINTKIKIINKKNNIGEICIKGPQITSGYWNNKHETKKSIINKWLYTGDLGYIKNNYLYITDRKKNMIIISGFNIYPKEIEIVLNKHPLISEIVVIGKKSQDNIESIVAFIVLFKKYKEDYKNIKLSIIQYAKNNLARYKIPKYIIFIKKIPKNPIGKIVKKDLLNILSSYEEDKIL